MDAYHRLISPVAKLLEPEAAHQLAKFALRCGLVPSRRQTDPPILQSTVFGIRFPNPIGLAAGFDKGALVPIPVLHLGFGFVEVGTVTPRPQVGNPKPRLFRLDEDHAIINRLGFNNDGIEAVAVRLRKVRKKTSGLIGINVGMNRDTDNPISDYVNGVRQLSRLGNYLVINISSPNTAGLRDLQRKHNVRPLLNGILSARAELPQEDRVPVLIKISPDLERNEIADISAVVIEMGVDGIIVSNTTISRSADLKSKYRDEVGGLSGRPLRPLSNQILGEVYKCTNGTVPIIGVGGVESGQDAYHKIRLGASLIQLYTALVFHGPSRISQIKAELVSLLSADGFENIAEAVGADFR